MSSAEKVLLGSFNCGRRNVGAALLIKGEGTSCGSRPRPIARKTTRTRNKPRGIKYFSISAFPLRPSAYLCVLCVKVDLNAEHAEIRRDTQRRFLRFCLHRSGY